MPSHDGPAGHSDDLARQGNVSPIGTWYCILLSLPKPKHRRAPGQQWPGALWGCTSLSRRAFSRWSPRVRTSSRNSDSAPAGDTSDGAHKRFRERAPRKLVSAGTRHGHSPLGLGPALRGRAAETAPRPVIVWSRESAESHELLGGSPPVRDPPSNGEWRTRNLERCLS